MSRRLRLEREVLVTGANGFVGSHICEALIENGYSVRALVRRSSDLSNLKGVNVALTYGDLSAPETLEAAVKNVYAVVNNAGITKANDPELFYKINCGGTENIIRAIIKCNPGLRRLIHISSTAACGSAPAMEPIKEDYPPHPVTAYGRSKLDAEKAVESYKNKVPSVILRPCAVYGPRDKEMLSIFKAAKWGLKPAFGRSQSYINFTFVKDLAHAVTKVIDADTLSGGVYFVAEKKFYSYSEACGIIAGHLGKKARDFYIPEPILRFAGKAADIIAKLKHTPTLFSADKINEFMERYWLFDTSKIENEMGFIGTDFSTGTAVTIAWYKEKAWL
jgi:nucleoside-diphosphate-sugar epimerase